MLSDVVVRMFTTGGIQKPGNRYSWSLENPVFFFLHTAEPSSSELQHGILQSSFYEYVLKLCTSELRGNC
jgi:hypothetical protein